MSLKRAGSEDNKQSTKTPRAADEQNHVFEENNDEHNDAERGPVDIDEHDDAKRGIVDIDSIPAFKPLLNA